MDPPKEYKRVGSNNHTILSGLGLEEQFDLSLDLSHFREPNATSTALPMKCRDDILASYLRRDEKENFPFRNYDFQENINFEENHPSLRNASHSETLKQFPFDVDKFLPLKDENKFISGVLKESNQFHSSSDETDSSLFPNSSFLNQSKLLTLSGEKEAQCNRASAVGLPSMLIGEDCSRLKEGDKDSLCNPWEMSAEQDSQMGLQYMAEDPLKIDHNNGKSVCFGGKLASHSAPENSLLESFSGPVINPNSKSSQPPLSKHVGGDLSFGALIQSQVEQSGLFRDEEFHSFNLSEFAEAEKEALEGDRFEIDEAAEAVGAPGDMPDMSGFLNAGDVSIRPSLWGNLENSLFEPGKKVCIEDVLAARSYKLGSLGGRGEEMPSFGFQRDMVESPPKYVPDESTYAQSSSQMSCTFDVTPSKGEASISLLEEEPTRDGHPPGGQLGGAEGYSQLLRKLVEKAGDSLDVCQLVDVILKCPNPDVTNSTIQDTMSEVDMSADVLQMKRDRECLLDRSALHPPNRQVQTKQPPQPQQSTKPLIPDIEITQPQLRNQPSVPKHTPLPTIAKQTQLQPKPKQTYPQPQPKQTPLQSQPKQTPPQPQQALKQPQSHPNQPSPSHPQPPSHQPQMQEARTGPPVPLNASVSGAVPKARSGPKMRMGTGGLRVPLQTAHPAPSPEVSDADVSLEQPESKAPNYPAKVKLPSGPIISKPCLVGAKTQTEFEIKNPGSTLMMLTPKILEEYFKPASPPGPYRLTFAPLIMISPYSSCKVKLFFSSVILGRYFARIQFAVTDLIVPSHRKYPYLVNRELVFRSETFEPEVDIYCDNFCRSADFGLVPESCIFRKEITLVNHSRFSVPIILTLKQFLDSHSSLSWECGQAHLERITDSVASCELLQSATVKVVMLLRVPRMEILTVNEKGVCELLSHLVLSLDTPSDRIMPTCFFPITVSVGEVLLGTYLTKRVIEIESRPGETAVHEFKLRNKSLFPLRFSASATGHEGLSISPSEAALGLQEEGVLEIAFRDEAEADIEGKLSIMVEPDGMEMHVPIQAVSRRSTEYIYRSTQLSEDEEKQHQDTPKLDLTRLDKEVSLVSNKSVYMFEFTPVGGIDSKKMTLKNCWTHGDLTLHMLISGTDAFWFEDEDGQNSKFCEVVLPPQVERTIPLYFQPSAPEAYSGAILCKPRGVSNPVKVTFPLQGFGGCAKLLVLKEVGSLSPCQALVFDNLIIRESKSITATVTNTGDRYVFVCFYIKPDENQDPFFRPDLCSTEPESIVLSPGQTKELVVEISPLPCLLKEPGKFAVIHAIYGEEILRRRYRRLKIPKCNGRLQRPLPYILWKLNKPIEGEEEALVEEDPFPSMPEDLKFFDRACKNSFISLCVNSISQPEEREDPSASVLQAVPLEDTCTSFIDSPSNNGRVSPPAAKWKVPLPHMVKNKNVEFDVHPSRVRIDSCQSPAKELSVMNYTDKEKMLEVICKDKWLKIEPREFCVAPNDFFVLKVQPLVSALPRNFPKYTRTTFQVLGENDHRDIQVEFELDPSFAFEKLPIEDKRLVCSRKSVMEAAPEKGPVSTDTKERKKNEETATIEVEREVKFPPTKVLKRSIAKLTLKNYGPKILQIRITFQSDHFHLRHTDFPIKAHHCIQIPVYFDPKEKGEQRTTLLVKLFGNKKISTEVMLKGLAI